MEDYSPTDMGSPFDSEQLLLVSSKLSSVITEILENVKVFARRRRRREQRQGNDNTSTFSSKTAELIKIPNKQEYSSLIMLTAEFSY